MGKRAKPIFLLLLSVGLFTSPLFNVSAQNVPPTAEPERIEKGLEEKLEPKATEEPIEILKRERVSRPELEKIRFILHDIEFEGKTVFEKKDLEPLYDEYLSKEISLADLAAIADRITAFYRNEGYLLSQAIIPPQKIRKGVAVKIRIIEGYIDEVIVEGKIRGSRNLINDLAQKLKRSKPLHQRDLERYLLLIQDISGLQVKTVLTPSKKETGASTLTLIVEQDIVNGYVGLDNRGSRYNGPFRGFAGFDFHTLLGVQEKTGVQLVLGAPPEEIVFVHGYQDHFINAEGTRFSWFAMYSNTEPGHTLQGLNTVGQSSNAGIRLSHPWIRSRRYNWTTSFDFAFKFAETSVNRALSALDRIRVVSLSSAFDFVDGLKGVNLLNFKFSKGLDILFATESGSPFLSRGRGQSDFTKIEGGFIRLQQIVPKLFLQEEVAGQLSFDHLLAFEEFGVGGSHFGRGYDPSEITGDHGFGGKCELQFAQKVDRDFLKSIQFYSFFDSGMVWHKDAPNNEAIYSAGGGLRLNFFNHLTANVEAAKPLSRNVEAEGNRKVRFFFTVRGDFDA